MKNYDVAVIGAGPGGYVAALRAAKLGCKVALIEAGELGGTCLNRGCIPSKTLLRHAELIEQVHHANSWGIETGELRFSLKKMMERKDKVIQRLRSGISSLLASQRVEQLHGLGFIHPDRTISVSMDGRTETIRAEKIILATGSTPFVPNIPGIRDVAIHTSDTIFDIEEIPNSITIIGGGVIGVEFACIFASLGSKVTIVEMAPQLLPNEDSDASAFLLKELRGKKITCLVDAKVEALRQDEQSKAVEVRTKDGKIESVLCDQVLVAVGRTPNLSAVQKLSLQMNGQYIQVNKYMETSLSNIFAVGDVVGGLQLAHVASAEGMVAAANAADIKERMDYSVIPRCVYTLPEIASVGLSEEEARKKGYAVKVEKVPFSGNGKALSIDDPKGFVKIIAEEKHGEILGVVMAGAHVTELISEASAYMYLEGTVGELSGMIHPHPSLAEVIYEGAAAWMGRSVHQ